MPSDISPAETAGQSHDEELAEQAKGLIDKATPFPIGTVEQILERAPRDLVEETLAVPEWECAVKVRSLTAAASARIKQVSLDLKDQGAVDVAWAEMEIAQFTEGVQEPKFDEVQVRELHQNSGRGFQRVIDWLDKQSGTNKEELRKAQTEFLGPDD